jgi:hypothetical protein
MALELIPLAIASAFWPILVAVVIISLRRPNPVRLLVAFLAGGLLATVSIGLVIVYLLQDSSLLSDSKSTTDPVVYLVGGAAALAIAYVLARRPGRASHRETDDDRVADPPGRMDRALARGAPVAFLAGVILNIAPGVVPLVALKDIAELDYTVAHTVLTVTAFYVVMFAFIEVPLLAYLFVPARTATEAERFNGWLDRNSRKLTVYALGAVGVYLVARGLIAAIDA